MKKIRRSKQHDVLTVPVKAMMNGGALLEQKSHLTKEQKADLLMNQPCCSSSGGVYLSSWLVLVSKRFPVGTASAEVDIHIKSTLKRKKNIYKIKSLCICGELAMNVVHESFIIVYSVQGKQ